MPSVTIFSTLATKKIPKGTPMNVFLRTSPVVFIGVGKLKMVRNAVLSGMPDGKCARGQSKRQESSTSADWRILCKAGAGQT